MKCEKISVFKLMLASFDLILILLILWRETCKGLELFLSTPCWLILFLLKATKGEWNSVLCHGERCENYSCFKLKVTASLICLQPVLKRQLKVEEKNVMIKVITVPLSLPWEYKGKYMRCRSHAFILPINLMKYLWNHDKHNITKQVKVQFCVVFWTVISENCV